MKVFHFPTPTYYIPVLFDHGIALLQHVSFLQMFPFTYNNSIKKQFNWILITF